VQPKQPVEYLCSLDEALADGECGSAAEIILTVMSREFNLAGTMAEKMADKFEEIADIRGSGLFLGVEIVDEQGKPNTKLASKIKNELRQKFILISTDGPYDSVLKINPPLSFTKKYANTVVEAIHKVLVRIQKK
jgi:4-aminobutyrate aminotransferase-like enzyme